LKRVQASTWGRGLTRTNGWAGRKYWGMAIKIMNITHVPSSAQTNASTRVAWTHTESRTFIGVVGCSKSWV